MVVLQQIINNISFCTKQLENRFGPSQVGFARVCQQRAMHTILTYHANLKPTIQLSPMQRIWRNNRWPNAGFGGFFDFFFVFKEWGMIQSLLQEEDQRQKGAMWRNTHPIPPFLTPRCMCNAKHVAVHRKLSNCATPHQYFAISGRSSPEEDFNQGLWHPSTSGLTNLGLSRCKWRVVVFPNTQISCNWYTLKGALLQRRHFCIKKLKVTVIPQFLFLEKKPRQEIWNMIHKIRLGLGGEGETGSPYPCFLKKCFFFTD